MRGVWYMQDVDKATEVLEELMSIHPGSIDYTHINILAELYMQQGQHARVTEVIQRAAELMSDQDLPIDLQVGPRALNCLTAATNMDSVPFSVPLHVTNR